MGLWKRKLGIAGEDLASEYLRAHGFQILERNVRTRFGEIDIVAKKKGEWYFVEVKTRTSETHGAATESFPPYRVRRLQQMAEGYLHRIKAGDSNAHLSLLAIDGLPPTPEIQFIPDIIE